MSEKHWLRPLSGQPRRSIHVLPWIATELDTADVSRPPRRLTAGQVNLHVIDSRVQETLYHRHKWDGTGSGLADALAHWQEQCRTVYLWLARGWSDLVLSGFAELIDKGAYVWRFATIEGAKVIMVGQLAGRPLTVTSLAAWTGKGGDTWSGIEVKQPVQRMVAAIKSLWPTGQAWLSSAEQTALGSVYAIVSLAKGLNIGSPGPTAAATGRRLWRCWAGPRTLAVRPPKVGAKRGQSSGTEEYVGPLCARPDAARAAERHVCYPLPLEQHVVGRVDGPVALLDIRQAYWAALAQAALPVCYTGTVRNPPVPELQAGLATSGGLALVRVDDRTVPYPLRWHGRSAAALGNYWTWLCGEELQQAALSGAVKECAAWHRWSILACDRESCARRALLAAMLAGPDYAALVKPFRAVYSSLVGSFARWDRQWTDVDHPHCQGRWSTWVERDAKTGGIVRYRCIGGRTQLLTELVDPPTAVPLYYGCVTAHLRCLLRELAAIIGAESVLALSADTLWVRGGAELLAAPTGSAGELARNALRVKAVYDRVWLDGHGRAVVEGQGQRWAHTQGVPLEPVSTEDGHVVWCAQGEWTCGELKRLKRGVPIVRKSYNASRLLAENDFPARPRSPYLALQDGLFREELLLPVLHPRSAGRREVET